MRHTKLLPLKQSRVVYRKPSKMMSEIYIKYLNQKNVWLLTIIRFYYAIHNDMWSIITWVVAQPAYLHQQHMSRYGVQHSDSYITTKWKEFFLAPLQSYGITVKYSPSLSELLHRSRLSASLFCFSCKQYSKTCQLPTINLRGACHFNIFSYISMDQELWYFKKLFSSTSNIGKSRFLVISQDKNYIALKNKTNSRQFSYESFSGFQER